MGSQTLEFNFNHFNAFEPENVAGGTSVEVLQGGQIVAFVKPNKQEAINCLRYLLERLWTADVAGIAYSETSSEPTSRHSFQSIVSVQASGYRRRLYRMVLGFATNEPLPFALLAACESFVNQRSEVKITGHTAFDERDCEIGFLSTFWVLGTKPENSVSSRKRPRR